MRRIFAALSAIFILGAITMATTNYTEPVPLTELGTDTYQYRQGGLYPGGQNEPLSSYVANEVQPAYDVLANDNHIVVLCLGMSNLKHTCNALISKLDGRVNPAVKIVNAGQPGRAQKAWDDNTSSRVWVNANKRLAQNGESPVTVDIAIYFNAWSYPTNTNFESYAYDMQQSLRITMDNIAAVYPNTQLIYVTSREYAGHAVTNLNPELWAYWDGFAFKWLVADRIDGLTGGPPLLWLAYQWDPAWPQSYFREGDGVHLSDDGLNVAGDLWLNAFLQEPWFATSPTATVPPTSVSTGTSTPGATPADTAVPTETAVPALTSTPGGEPTGTPCSGWSPECFCEQNPDARICN